MLITDLIIFALFGLIIGSFLNVVIHRLPIMLQREWRLGCYELLQKDGVAVPETTATPRYHLCWPGSQCPTCQHSLRWYENIPLISFLCLKGRCRYCKGAIAWRYPAVELLTALLFATMGWHYGYSLLGYASLAFVALLIALSVIDLKHLWLPDPLNYILLWLGLLINSIGGWVSCQNAIIGAIVGYLILWSIYWVAKWISGREGLGYGDFKLLAAIGAWLGWQLTLLTLMMASIIGALAGIAWIALGKHSRQQPLPFGPYLALAGLISMLWGIELIDWYLRWLHF